jgi:ribose transport system ATP-binding protein
MVAPRVRFSNLCKRYPGVQAMDQVSIDIAPASIHALVGENGAGKSTLIKILAGATPADSGTIAIDGRKVSITNARDAQQLGISVVYQEFNLVAELSVAENIFLGRWPHNRLSGAIDFARLHHDAQGLLNTLGIRIPITERIAELSVAQKQMVEIAKALSLQARVLVLDEPSAVLTPHELRALFAIIRDARQRGVSIIYISHRLEEIFEIADSVSVLRDGRHISTRPIGEASRQSLIAEMVGRPLDQEFPHRESRMGEPVLRCKRLTGRFGFRDVTFEVHAGEVFGITGLVGAGRSTLGRALFGAHMPLHGTIQVGEQYGPFSNPRQAIAAGVVMVPEDRKSQGLLLQRPLRENVILAYRDSVARSGFFRTTLERETIHGMMASMQIRASNMETPVAALSGGNQQKVLLARWMIKPQRVLILDEPTRGIDVGAKHEIYTLINSLAAGGMAIIMISSELPEVIGMCDRIGVMHEGRLLKILPNHERSATQEQILRIASGEVAA